MKPTTENVMAGALGRESRLRTGPCLAGAAVCGILLLMIDGPAGNARDRNLDGQAFSPAETASGTRVTAPAELPLTPAVLAVHPSGTPDSQATPAGQAQPQAGAYNEESLVNLSLNAMKAVESPVSPLRQRLVAKLLARVALEVLETDDQRLYWIAVIGRESKFDGRATSKAGAVGLGQLIPRYAKDFGALCGMQDLETSDIADDQVNAYLSACYFKALVRRYDGVIPLALAGYNAGPNSRDVKAFKNLGSMNHESANYVSGVWLIAHGLK